MLAIDEEKDFEYVELDREESFVETLNRFKSATQKEYPLSKDYENILRDYQKELDKEKYTLHTSFLINEGI